MPKSKGFGQLLATFEREKTVVLDLGSHSVKGLNLYKKGDTVLVNDAFEIEKVEKFYNGKDLSNIDGLATEIQRVMKLADIRHKKLDLMYNSSTLQTKIIRVPDMSDKEIKEFVEIEYHKSFANVSSHTHVLDYLQFGLLKEDERNEQLLLLAAVPASEPTKILKTFESKGYHINSIETNIHALGNALNLVDNTSEYKVILHIGKEYSLILFCRGTTPVFYRMFTFGYDMLTRRLYEDLNTSFANVDGLMKNVGFGEIGGYQTDVDIDQYDLLLREQFNMFINEVYRSINYVKMQMKFEPTHIYLSGGMAHMSGIGSVVGDNLALAVKKWSFQGGEVGDHTFFLKNQQGLGPEYALAIGLAARGWM